MSTRKPVKNGTGKQPTYEIVLYWSDQDNAVIAEVPELPGCMADGATYQEAVSAAEVVIREWIETAQELGREIPKPRGKLMYA
jgi:predicted RNase H-like HicB family nuclease